MRRYANKKDSNHDEAVTLLRQMGAVCIDIDLSTGIDLLVGYRGVWCTVEIKAHKGKETKRQKDWARRCQDLELPHHVLREGEPVSPILDAIAASRHQCLAQID